MALSLKRQVEAARAKLDKATDAIYAAAHPSRDVVFSACKAMAAPDVVAAYEAASDQVFSLEYAACSSGKAWRSPGGSLFWK